MSRLDFEGGSHGPGGQSFCEPLWLPGWSERSVWGFDEPTGSYFAQLWPDEDGGEAPAVWVGALGGLGGRHALATEVSAATRQPVAAVEALLRLG